jgi:hypothetical protein
LIDFAISLNFSLPTIYLCSYYTTEMNASK